MGKLFDQLSEEKEFIDLLNSVTDEQEKQKIIDNAKTFLELFENQIISKLQEAIESPESLKEIQDSLSKNVDE
jgi:GMP synthase PP-ATPase subunit